MNLELGLDAIEYGQSARRAFEAAGGDELVIRADADPAGRDGLLGPVLRQLGAFDLRPRTDADELEAAAALCRSAGYHCVPYPVAECLAAPADLDVDGLIIIDEHAPAAAVAGLDKRWVAVTLGGARSAVVVQSAVRPALVADLTLTGISGDGAADVALGLVLPAWTLLGMLDRAMDLTVEHVRLREQFGQPLSRFQGVQFQLTDAEVERAGLEMLAKYALASIAAGRPEAVDDALATRAAALEAAEVVFRVCHQLHGAVGFCDETVLSWLSRYSQPLRRLPWGLSRTRDLLVQRAGRAGLRGLYA
ncbi:acyl-CoA dehydrogenase family protein [Mycolicibacter sp. MYC123]|uniref:Acyl-CoA dehydrogenase family protein n=1 Tax=[Mycobacterium] zoologicum TaxID=2872311 RepID=A0ABU5YGN8_9MYCO|nr:MULTISPECIES: acyl-CoA dehydrogenase family protein [unclassified Mycolicibacter]MEB3049217.1 acyl-CoA dehydrogenase family protein [Mycolicibacter sp. MYC123]MEB3062516.1 acyl-CoA dehydrogenase family protein [Mycolicibacter sp. MYC101]